MSDEATQENINNGDEETEATSTHDETSVEGAQGSPLDEEGAQDASRDAEQGPSTSTSTEDAQSATSEPSLAIAGMIKALKDMCSYCKQQRLENADRRQFSLLTVAIQHMQTAAQTLDKINYKS